MENLSLCDMAPIGWYCSRDLNHGGTCAPIPTDPYNVVHSALNGLRGAKYASDRVGSRRVDIDIVDAGIIIGFLQGFEKFRPTTILGFPISNSVDKVMPLSLSGVIENDHRRGSHTYSALCILCTGS